MLKRTKTALSEDGRDRLLLDHLEYGGVALLLLDRNPQDDPQTTDHKGLKVAYMSLEEDSALSAVEHHIYTTNNNILCLSLKWWHSGSLVYQA